MARNEVYKDADYLSLPVPVGTPSGGPVRIGGLNGVAQTAEPTAYIAAQITPAYNEDPSSNRPGFASIALKGAWRFPVSTTTALAIGDPVYIVPVTNVLTPVAAGNQLYGHALSVKGTVANSSVIVRIAN